MAAINILNIEGNKVSRDLKGKYLLLYGEPKTGKTTFATQAPKALLVAFERGYNALPGVKAVDVTTWDKFKQVVVQLRKPEARELYDTIVIDTVGIAGDLAEQYVCAQNGVPSIDQVPYGQGWGLLTKEMDKTFRSITMMGYGLIFLAHSKTKNVGTMDNEILSYAPEMSKRTRGVVNGLVDVIGYIHQQFDEDGNSVRTLITRETPLIKAGSRFKSLPSEIEFSYDHLVKALSEAIEKDAGSTGFITDEPITIDLPEEKRPFSEAYNEARELWKSIVLDENGEIIEDEARTLRSFINEVFGQPYRISEMVPVQQDLLEEVILKMKEYIS